ncbi:MAG: zinc-binding dehydrogenase, partial [Actinomycetota bacterium]|nr:zinc-binding dehydrogenase [Actinomycetota bacterium]
FGATAVLDPAGDAPAEAAAGDGFDAFVDCSGAPAAVLAGLPAVRPGGVVVLVGMGADELSVPVPLIQNREITLTGTFRYANTYPEAIALAASGAVDLDGLVTGRVDLEHAEEALLAAPGSVKTVVRPGGGR